MITINPAITEKLIQSKIPINLGTLCLLGIYHGVPLEELHLDPELIVQLNLTKIVERDYQNREETPKLIWNIPLYADQEIQLDDNWAWIDDWRKLFGTIRPDAIGNKKDCYLKMKRFFANNPHIRKEDILAATKMYLLTFRGKDAAYLQRADYFISKIIKAEGGTQHNSRLEMYLELLKNSAAESAPQVSRQLGQLL